MNPQETFGSKARQRLSKQITQVLLREQLFASYKTIQSAPLKDQQIKTADYFAWTGSNLLALPKTLALIMVYEMAGVTTLMKVQIMEAIY